MVPAQPEPPEHRAAAARAADSTSPGTVLVERAPTAPAGYAALVSLHGEHDLASSEAIRATIEPIVGDLLVDLSACTFLDSTVIAVLLGKCYELRGAGQRLELILPPENVAISRVVDVVGMRGLMQVHERVPAAASATDG